MVEALRTDSSMRQICEVLGFHRSNLYYAPKSDPSEEILRAEIEKLALQYPTYGYRKPITKLLQRQGHTVGYKRVARLMKAANLSVAVKRLGFQTTTCVEGGHPYVNRLESLEISRCDQVWVADIPYVRLKRGFVYVSLLMDVFTRMIRGWQVSRHLTQPLTLNPLEQETLRHSVPEIHHSDQGAQYLSKAYVTTLQEHGVEVSGVSRRGCPWENGYAERLIRTLKEEEVHLNDSENITEARNRIGKPFIEHKYHRKRPHSETLGGSTPMEFEQQTLD